MKRTGRRRGKAWPAGPQALISLSVFGNLLMRGMRRGICGGVECVHVCVSVRPIVSREHLKSMACQPWKATQVWFSFKRNGGMVGGGVFIYLGKYKQMSNMVLMRGG